MFTGGTIWILTLGHVGLVSTSPGKGFKAPDSFLRQKDGDVLLPYVSGKSE